MVVEDEVCAEEVAEVVVELATVLEDVSSLPPRMPPCRATKWEEGGDSSRRL